MGETAASSFQTSSCLGNSLNLVCTLVTVVKISEHTKKAREYEIPQHVLTIQFDVVLNSNHSMYPVYEFHSCTWVRKASNYNWMKWRESHFMSNQIQTLYFKLDTSTIYFQQKNPHQLLALIQHACALT